MAALGDWNHAEEGSVPLTPDDVRTVVFKRPPIGRRGYDEEDVDAFLEDIETELARLREVNASLKAQLAHTQPIPVPENDKPADVGQDNARLARENTDLRNHVQRLEQQVRAAAAQPAPATKPAAPTGQDDGSLSVLLTAQRTAEMHLSEARREAEHLLSDARAKAEEVTREANAKAGVLERRARERHQEAMVQLEAKRAAVQQHIDELQAFDHQYRSRLKASLDAQMRDLDGPAQGGAAAVIDDDVVVLPTPRATNGNRPAFAAGRI